MSVNIFLDESCVGEVIYEEPYVKLLTVPKQDEDGRWTALAQVIESLALIEVKVTSLSDAEREGGSE